MPPSSWVTQVAVDGLDVPGDLGLREQDLGRLQTIGLGVGQVGRPERAQSGDVVTDRGPCGVDVDVAPEGGGASLEDVVVRHVFLLLLVVVGCVGVVLSGLLEGGLDDDADSLLLLVGEVVPDVLHGLLLVLVGVAVVGGVRSAVVSVGEGVAEVGDERLRVLDVAVAVLDVHLVDLRLGIGPLEDERNLDEIRVGDDGAALLHPGREDREAVERPVLHLGPPCP